MTHFLQYKVEVEDWTVCLDLSQTVNLPLSVSLRAIEDVQLTLFWSYVAQRLHIACNLIVTVASNNGCANPEPAPAVAAGDTAVIQPVSKAAAAVSAILSLLVAIPRGWDHYALGCQVVDLTRFTSTRPVGQNLKQINTFWPPKLDYTTDAQFAHSTQEQNTVSLAELVAQLATDQLSRGLAYFPTVDKTAKSTDQAALIEVLFRPDPLRSSEHVMLRHGNANAALCGIVKSLVSQLRLGLPSGDIYCIIDSAFDGDSYQLALALALYQAMGWLSPCALDATPFATGQLVPQGLNDHDKKQFLANLRGNSPVLQVYPINELERKWRVFDDYKQYFPHANFYLSTDQTDTDGQMSNLVKIRALQEHLLGEVFRNTYLNVPAPQS
ncbi:hypothetical protein [Rheinheimera sp. F8]|uniref:hypothetical protein n=1 Tax=Rheinheimera sp. F8 TaxID=1763998 RepID=UPI00074497F6|nr:hypothetical protein [Rheinheimera sp. F8]ALZ76709.1 hypothetical protein ATY27_13705 [Rheinheimera sp. F8]